MRVIVFASRKGGSGKTTLLAHLAVQAMLGGEDVTMVDLDPQQNLKAWWDARPEDRLKLAQFLESTPEKRLKPGRRFFERPIFDSVRAGSPHPAGDMRHDTITIDEYLVNQPSRTVLVTVKGDSMVDAGIMEGDTVVVEKKNMANIGDMVIAIVDNEFTLKTLGREKSDYILIPANKAYPVLRPKGGLEIFGVVVGQFRKYK